MVHLKRSWLRDCMVAPFTPLLDRIAFCRTETRLSIPKRTFVSYLMFLVSWWGRSASFYSVISFFLRVFRLSSPPYFGYHFLMVSVMLSRPVTLKRDLAISNTNPERAYIIRRLPPLNTPLATYPLSHLPSATRFLCCASSLDIGTPSDHRYGL